jgi:hypothetical protein
VGAGRIWRHRRLARTASIGLVVVAAALLALWWSRREERYVPGERSEGLIDTLARNLPADRPRVTFTDASLEAGIDFVHFSSARSNQLPEDMGSGVAAGDYDGDGWCDFFVMNVSGNLAERDAGFPGSDATARLYRNRGDGTFEDATARAGLGLKAIGHGAAFLDYDGDRDLDLFATTYDRCFLWRNEGDGRFADVSDASGVAEPRGFWTGIAVGDYDRDGAVDVYVCGYVQYDPTVTSGSDAGAPVSIPVRLNPSSFRPERNLLFRNRGDGSFEEVGAKLDVQDLGGRSLGATMADLNGDLWPDVYVADDVSKNAFYVNQGDGTFREKGAEALVADYRGAMGLAVADFDDDLDFDVFITHWIGEENALYVNVTSELDADARIPGTAWARTRRLLFMDEADLHGLGQIALDVVGWATGAFDLDHDGRRDLFVLNGHTIPLRDDPARLEPQRSHLFWNGGAERGWFEIGQVAGDWFRETHVARGGALLDYDRDGDDDLLVVEHAGRARLLRNDGGDALPCVRLRLRQGAGNTLAIGAHVLAAIGGRRVLAQAETQGSYLSQHEAGELCFGLGAARELERLEVTWPDGATESAGPFAADSVVTWLRGTPPVAAPLPGRRAPGAISPDGAPRGASSTSVAAQREFFGLLEQANSLRVEGDFAGAAAIYRRLLELRPGHEDSLYYHGNCLVELEREREALAEFEQLVRVNPRSNRGFMQIGRIRLPGGDPALDDLGLAEKAFRESLAINQEESGPIVALGVVALLRGELDRAEESLAAAAVLNSKSVEARYLRAWIAYRRGDREAARALLEEAHAIATGVADASRPKVVGEGDTRKGGALVADHLARDRSPIERWKSLAQRAVDVDAEFAALEER